MLIRVKCIGQKSSQGVLTFPSIMPYLKVLVVGAILFCSLELQITPSSLCNKCLLLNLVVILMAPVNDAIFVTNPFSY